MRAKPQHWRVGCEANLLSGQSQTCLYLCFAFVYSDNNLWRRQWASERARQRQWEVSRKKSRCALSNGYRDIRIGPKDRAAETAMTTRDKWRRWCQREHVILGRNGMERHISESVSEGCTRGVTGEWEWGDWLVSLLSLRVRMQSETVLWW